ncbi:hypothetical protein TWF694_003353 [Orbilia ellipsospora]|uniref:NACHT domain-containing protein n=1 Tax=Orbilia ellipsospora TaxID=2528407 RepID=A0AAV9WYY4_9PEZI
MVTAAKSHSDYTIGWVCALPKEQTAAVAMLDQTHPDLPMPSNDSNTYTLGSIGGHNIVVVCCPAGKMGTVQAGIVATRMVGTFQSIKAVLMVGIGGGVPPKVRLGDIVVSKPSGQYPGVVQWDFGKAEKDGKFQRTGTLNGPPNAILTALSKLETGQKMEGTKIPQHMEDLKKKLPEYTWNDSLKDPWPLLLDDPHRYQSRWQLVLSALLSIIIALGQLFSWRACASPDIKVEGVVDVDAATSEKDDRKPGDINIHYGLIASGNQVIKDAKRRDEINESLDGAILCFEMEAAGLMDDFPCLVIRGICDYADERKNKDWQEYAAALAAAFAKELLGYIQPADVDKERPVKEIWQRVHEEILSIKSKLDKKEDLEILNWLTLFHYGSEQSDVFQKRQPGTGKWLLDSKEYQKWLTAEKQVLFCRGIPGAGKTVLTSIVVDHLSTWILDDGKIGIAYIYCNFKRTHEQRLDDLLASLLKQLSERQPFLPENVRALYERHQRNKTRPSRDDIRQALRAVVSLYSKTFIIIDALDECQAPDRCRAKFVSELFQLHNIYGTSIFATARPIQEIEAEFVGNTILEIRACDEDVRAYLDGQISQADELVKSHSELIKTKITKEVDGMFLLARLYFDAIKTPTTVKVLKNALAGFRKGPDAYNLAYDETMKRINQQDQNYKDLANKVLEWIIYAKRPLTTSELRHALAVEPETRKLDEENIPTTKLMLSVCAGLVVVEGSDIIRLVHYTTQEYFDQKGETYFPFAQANITEICVTYLLYDTFQSGASSNDKDFETRLQSNALYDYAARNWGDHARTAKAEAAPSVLRLLECENHVSACCQVMFVNRGRGPWIRGDYSQGFPKRQTELHLGSYWGLEECVAVLFSRGSSTGTNIDPEDSYGRTPLSWAAENGHEAVVRLLVERGADMEAADNVHRTPLSWAAKNGHEAIVRLLE